MRGKEAQRASQRSRTANGCDARESSPVTQPLGLCLQRCNSKCVSEQTFYRLMQSFALVLFE